MAAERAEIRTRWGFASLGPRALAVQRELDRRFAAMGDKFDVEERLYPPMLTVPDLNRFDYFRNFPNLALLATTVQAPACHRLSGAGLDAPELAATDLTDADLVLPPAACYNVYLDEQGQASVKPHCVTTVATCFRRESSHDGLRRLSGFALREIVFIGSRDYVLAGLAGIRQTTLAYLDAIGLAATFAPANDPFFDRNSSRALLQRLFPAKEELRTPDGLAIGSINYHRNFFGERADLRLTNGEFTHTGCVGFGLERWISALTDRFGADLDEIQQRVTDA